MTQSAHVDGVGNITVQLNGDGNTVAVTPRDLVLTSVEYRMPVTEVSTPLHLLDTFRMVTRFVGRAEEMADLNAWMDAPAPIKVKVVTGRSGSGKTRLAIELLQARDTAGWQSGFAKHDEVRRFAGNGNMAELRWTKPTYSGNWPTIRHAVVGGPRCASSCSSAKLTWMSVGWRRC